METSHIPRGTLSITMANAAQYIIMVLFYMIVTKTNALTQTDIGILSIISFLASTFSLLTVLNLNTALTKFTSENLVKNQKEEASSTQKTVFKIVLAFSIVGLIVAVLLSSMLSQYLLKNPEYIFLIILNFGYAFISNIIILCNSTLQALFLFGKMATLTFTYIVSSRIIAITLTFLHFGVTGVITGYIIGSIITLILAINFLRGKLPKTNKTVALKPILFFSFPLVLTSITGLVLNWADIIIVTSLTSDLSLTGIYHIVINSVGALSILFLPLMTTIFPTISANHGLQKPENISSVLKTASRIIIYLILPSSITLAIIAPTALTFFYGPNYTEGAIPLGILSISTILIAIRSLFATTLTAMGKTTQILKINIIAAISSISLFITFVPFLEITGAALARLATQAIMLIITVYLLKEEIKIRLDKDAFWKSAVAVTALVPLLLIIELILSPRLTTTQTLVTEMLIALVIYLFMLYVLKALKNQDFQLLKQALPKPLTKYIDIIERIIVR